ncbi:MAG: oxidative damage protection protein [Moraxellaceae bacterium]
MTRMVNCRKLGKEAEGLAFPPFPGPVGQTLFETVSKEAWQLWLKEQTMIINENRLSVMDPQAQKFLAEQREKFLSNEEYERAKGWVPEKS